MPRTRSAEYVVRRPAQLRTLASPIRQSVVNGLEGLGSSTVGRARPAPGSSARRAETVYALPGPVLSIDSENRSAQWLAGL